MTATHHCTDRCSHHVTDAQLGGWGFPVEKTDTVCGQKVVVVEGTSHGRAVYEAWKAGFVRICTKTDRLFPHDLDVAA